MSTSPIPGNGPENPHDGDAGLPDVELPADLEIPDDLSALTAAQDPELALLITQVADAQALAAACSLADLDVDAAPTPIGALAILRRTGDDEPARAAAAVSQLVRGVPLVLVTRTSGQLSAVRYEDGRPDGELAPGLVLGGAPEALEDLVTGQVTVADLPGVVPSSSIGKLKAMRMLTGAARKSRKQK
jgi:hypothetical protein